MLMQHNCAHKLIIIFFVSLCQFMTAVELYFKRSFCYSIFVSYCQVFFYLDGDLVHKHVVCHQRSTEGAF